LASNLVLLSLDPRIKRIKQQEKEAREAKKRTATGSGASTPRRSKAEEEADKKRLEEEAKRKEEEEKVELVFHSGYFITYWTGCTRGCEKAETGCCKCC
jgi:4-diphosphocytidyl-2C-methyl-D-erythritol kinase